MMMITRILSSLANAFLWPFFIFFREWDDWANIEDEADR